MNPENIFNSKNVKTIVFITVLVIILGLVVSFVQTPKYKSSAKLLVVFSQENMNSYTSAQTSNYIAGILAEVVYSNSFIDGVFKTNFGAQDNLSFDPEKRMKNWKKMVKTNIVENKGIIIVDVYHTDKEQANKLAQAISYSLITNNQEYHGSGNSVVVKIISSPNVSDQWAKPNIWQNLLLSLLAGIFIGLTFIIVFPEQDLVNFIWGRKIIVKDEMINLPKHNNSIAAADFNETSAPSDNQYSNW